METAYQTQDKAGDLAKKELETPARVALGFVVGFEASFPPWRRVAACCGSASQSTGSERSHARARSALHGWRCV
eukprot:5926935-Amphidinium_carterae.1